MKNIAAIFSATVVALMTVCAFGETVTPANYEKTVTISLSDDAKTALGDETLTDFPVLVRLSASIGNFSYADFKGENGSDLRFALEDGTLLSSEVDTWDVTGTSLVWVKVPSLAAATKIIAYYGNANPDAMTPSDTWSAYAGVWHFKPSEAGGTKVSDATGNGFDATTTAELSTYDGPMGVSTLNSGAIVQAPDYDSKLTSASVFSASGWFKCPNQVSSYVSFVHKKIGLDWNSDKGWYLEMTQSKTKMNLVLSSTSAADIPDVTSNWNFFYVTSDGSTVKVYMNGATSPSITWGNYAIQASGTAFKIADSLSIGDEYRVLNSTASALRTSIEYKTMSDAGFCAYGVVTTIDPTAIKFQGKATVTKEGDAFQVSVTTKDSAQLAGSIAVRYGTNGAYDLSDTITASAAPATTYTGTLTHLAANTSYKVRVEGTSTAGSLTKADSDDVLYNGTLTIAKGADADELHPETPGTFTVSRADSYGDLVVNYTVGGTAVAGVNYEALSGTVTIPDGASSATIEVNAIPVYKADTTLTLTLAAGLYNIDAEAASASLAIKAFLPGETYLKKIVFDSIGYTGATTLNDFPVLVRFSSAIAGFSYGDFKNPSTGSDLVFTTEAGVPLEYEIDTWNAAGESLVWVKVPSLTAGTKIVAYYGSSEAPSRTAAGTWSSRYLGVWHFNAISGGSTPDATGHGLAMTATDVSTQVTAADGAVGGALVNASESGGSNGGFLSPTYTDQFTNSSFTVSAWYNRLGHAMNGYERYFSSKLTYNAANGFEMENSGGSAELSSARGSDGGGISVQIPKQDVAGWFMLTLAYDGTTLTAYTNGVASASGTVAAVNHQYGFAVGNNAARNERALWGNIDEVRFAKSCENAD